MALLPTNVGPPPVEASPTAPASRRRFRPWLAFLAAAVFLVAGWLGGRSLVADARWKAAGRALAQYEFAEALGEFEGYLRIWPDSVPAQFQAARAARRADQFERAAEHLAVAEKAGVTPETALENLLALAQQGDLDGVEDPLWEQLRDNHPDSVLIAEALFRGYMKMSRLPPAWATLTLLLDHAPDHAPAYFWRANIGENSRRVSFALEDFRRAVRLAPRRKEFRLRLAEVLVKNARADEACPHFQELLRQSPDDPAVLLGIARCLRAFSRPSLALGHLDKLLRDHPENAEGWAERGLILGDQGEGVAALRCLHEAFTIDPTNYAFGLALYSELQTQGRDREAIRIRKHLEEMKGDALRLVEVIDLLAKSPRNADLRHEAGLISLRNKDEDAALRWFSGALEDEPDHRPAHRALADYYENKGDPERAELHRRRAGP